MIRSKFLITSIGSIFFTAISFLYAIIQDFIPFLKINNTQFFFLICPGLISIAIGFLKYYQECESKYAKILPLVVFILALVISALLIIYYSLLTIYESNIIFIQNYFTLWAISHHFFCLLFFLISFYFFLASYDERHSSTSSESTSIISLKILSGLAILILICYHWSCYSVYYQSQLKDITLNYTEEIGSFYGGTWKFKYSDEEIFGFIMALIFLIKSGIVFDLKRWTLSFWSIGVIGILISLIMYFEYTRD